MNSFLYEALPTRVVFGAGAFALLPQEAERIGARLLVLSTPEQASLAKNAAQLLGARSAGIFSRAVMHVPREVAAEAAGHARALRVDGLVSVGGGSTTGLAKAIALETGLPILAVPTTYAGSEMTAIWGVTEDGVKRTGKDKCVLPAIALYDPELSMGLPAQLSGVSGINAIAHCLEGLYSPDANPLVSIMAEEGIRAMASALPRIVADPSDASARSDALYGAWLGGVVLGSVGMALHHKLCHTLGGTFNLPHAETHAIVLPHAAAYNAEAAPDAMRRVARALGVKDASQGLFDLLSTIGAPRSLAELGMPASGIDQAVELVLTNPYYNPAPLVAARLRRLIANAYGGHAPMKSGAGA